MIPQFSKNVFIVTEPIKYTINISQANTINLPIATVTINETQFSSPYWNLQFIGALTLATTLVTKITCKFSLLKVGRAEIITTFNYEQSLLNENSTQHGVLFFKYKLEGNLLENLSDYILELTSISSDADSTLELTINNGTIIGIVIPVI